MKAALSFFMGALLLGAAAGWVSLKGKVGRAVDSPGAERQLPPASPPPVRERPLPTTAGLMEESKAWIKGITEKRFNPYAEEMARWTDEEIRAALEESLKNRDFLLDAKSARSMASGLLAEWMKRDCAAASDFFLTIPAPIRNGAMTYSFSVAWPANHAAEGLAFVKANPQVFEGASPWSIQVKNIEARAADGTASVISLLKEFREAKLGLAFENPVKFPDHFDFATLMKSPEVAALAKEGQGKFFARSWFAQDREACFDWVLENGNVRDLPTMIAFGPDDSSEGLRWIGTKYEAMSPSDRTAMVPGIPVGQAAVIDRMTAGIGDAEVADELRSVGAGWIFAGSVPGGLNVLAGISDPARRLEALEEIDQGKMRSLRPMSPGDAEILRKHLQEWSATPEQTEALMNKFRRLK